MKPRKPRYCRNCGKLLKDNYFFCPSEEGKKSCTEEFLEKNDSDLKEFEEGEGDDEHSGS